METAGGRRPARPTPLSEIRVTQILLVLLALEGCVALAGSLSSPSMGRRAFLWGYSIPRLTVALSLAGFTAVLLLCAVWAICRPSELRRKLWTFEAALERCPGGLEGLQGLLFYVSATGIYFLGLFQISSATSAPYLLRVAVDHLGLSLWWLVSIPLQILVVLLFLCRDRLGAEVARIVEAPHYLLLYVLILGGTLQCVTLMLRADVLFSIAGWFWESIHKPARMQQLLLVPIGTVAVLGIRRILGSPRSHGRNALLTILLLYLLQLAFGIAEGGGFESLRAKYSNAPISSETRSACEYPGNALEAVVNYEDNFATDFWLGTKPPGLLALFVAVRRLAGYVWPGMDGGIEACKYAMTSLFSYVLPLLAAIVVLPMLGLEKMLAEGENVHDSAILYLAVPSVLLMPLVRDQFLFPLLCSFALLVLGRAIVARSYVLGALAGILIFVATFFSFSLLPLVGLAIAWPFMETLRSGRSLGFRGALGLVAAVALGIAAAWAAGRILLEYDPVLRYTEAMEQHRAIKAYVADLANLRQYAVLNLVEFVMSVGFPFMLLFVLACIESLLQVARGRVTRKSAFALALIVSFIAMNIVGQTRGEVARLWLFVVVPFSIVAAGSFGRLSQIRILGVQVVFVVQLFIVLFTYMNMDFR